MTRMVLATASADFVKRVQQASDNTCVTLPLGPLPADPAQLFAQLKDGLTPQVVILDSGIEIDKGLDLASRFDQQFPSICVILVTDLYLEIGLEAMRVGVRDMLHPSMDVLDIRIVLDRARAAAEAQALVPEIVDSATAQGPVVVGRVITVVSPKGGVGKTTLATNLAVGLAQSVRHSTVLVDLDLQFGDIAAALNLEPEFTLSDAVHGPASSDTMVLKTFLTLHETGLYVICGPKTPAAADSITGPEISSLLRMLASEFSYVVVDTAAGLSEHVLAAMDETSDLLLVSRMEVPGIRALRKELDALSELGTFSLVRRVVLNFGNDHGGLTVDDVEATIGTDVDFVLPRSKAALESVNLGIPLMQRALAEPLTKQLLKVVSEFAPASEPKPRSRWSRLRPSARPRPGPVVGEVNSELV